MSLSMAALRRHKAADLKSIDTNIPTVEGCWGPIAKSWPGNRNKILHTTKRWGPINQSTPLLNELRVPDDTDNAQFPDTWMVACVRLFGSLPGTRLHSNGQATSWLGPAFPQPSAMGLPYV
jgi:hypothetical protein